MEVNVLVDPITEYKNITHWLSQLTGMSLTPLQFTQKLRTFLKPQPIKLNVDYTNLLNENDFTISASYDVWLDEEGKTPIMFTFLINHPLEEEWLITSAVADELAIELIETLAHEYQHLYQYRTRNYILPREYTSTEPNDEERAEITYLGNTDEIDAYAMNIAVRMYLRKDNRSLDLDRYRNAFGNDHRVVRRLLKKITKRLYYLENLHTSTET